MALAGLAVLVAVPAGGRAAQQDDAGAFLVSLKDRAILQLTDETIPSSERKQRFRVLFRENFDLPAIGQFVLGRYWRTAKPTVREDFLNAFEEIMVQRFAPIFEGYADTKFQIDGVRELKEKGQYVISSTILPGKGEVYKVDWRVRYRDERYQILDVIGEGVSMALTLRSEYASVIKSSGGQVEGLIVQLRERSAGGPDPQTSSNAAN